MNKERLDIDIFNTINYSNKNRSNFPIKEKEENFGDYYIIKSPNKSILKKSLIISKELDSHNENYYENYTNPNNFTQQNPNYLDSYSFCPPKHNMILYENRISPSNKYLYSDGNTIYNYIPNNAPKNDNGRFYIKINNKNNKDSIDVIQKENNQKINKQKVKADKYKNGVKLNISNLETQYPLTILYADPFNKRNNFTQSNIIKNMMNLKNSDDSRSLTFKKNKNKKNKNISQKSTLINIIEKLKNISSKENNDNKEQDSYDSHNYHKKNKSHLQSSNNALKEKYNEVHNNIKKDGINDSNLYKYKKKSPIGEVKQNKCYDNERNKYAESNYHNCPKYGIANKIQKSGNKNKSFDKKLYKKHQIQDISKLKKCIDNLEQIFALSIKRNYDYFIEKLKSEYKRNLILKRYKKKQSKNNYYTSINASPEEKFSLNNTINTKEKINLNNINYLNYNKNIYIPKNSRNRNINENNLSSYYNFSHSEIETIRNNHDYSDDNISKKIKDFTYKNKSLNKTQDNSNLIRRRLNASNDKEKYNTSVNNTLDNNSLIYSKPKIKTNLKKAINKNKKFGIKSINNKDSLPSIENDLLIKNNASNNNPFILINNDSFTSPIKYYKKHYRNISDIAQQVIDNASINTNNINYTKKEKNGFSDGVSDNSNENENTNADPIEEIMKYSYTDKKLSIFVKYIISPKTKQKFLEMKLQRLENIKEKGDNKEIKIEECTDSFQLNSPFSKINPYFRNSECSNHRKMEMKEVKEISEENDSIIEDENKNNMLLNITDILEKYKNKNILYLKDYFFKQLIIFYSNINIETLIERNIFKNIQNNIQSLDISNLSDSDNNINCFSFRKDYKIKKDNGNENQVNNYNKTGENWKSNLLFNMLEKERNFQSEEENYFSGNISMLEEKNLNLHKKK